MAKKKDLIDIAANEIDRSQTFNPLLIALRENDKKNLFTTNITTAFHKTGFPIFDYYFGSVVNIHNELGELIQQEARVGQAAGTFNMIVGNTGSGKAQPISTKIPSPNGIIKMGDLQPGDTIFGSNGNSIKVTGVYPQGIKDIYQITFSDGRTALCCGQHLWSVYELENPNKLVTKSMIDIYINYKTIKSDDETLYSYSIPVNNNIIEYNNCDIHIDPYTLGCLLGNANLEYEELTIFGIPDKIRSTLEKNTSLIIKNDFASYMSYFNKVNEDGSLTILSTKDFLSKCPMLIGVKETEKRIPKEYMFNSYNIRTNVLAGIFDRNAFYNVSENDDNFYISYHCDSENLLKDIQYILRSFGVNSIILKDQNPVEGTEDKYGGTIYFITTREFKHEIFKHGPYRSSLNNATTAEYIKLLQSNDNNPIKIVKIKFSHVEEAVCIKVDAPDELYLTEDFIITHNTTLTVQIAANIIRQYKYANIIHFDCEQRFDISRGETISQLPASYFNDAGSGARYVIKSGSFGLDSMQETIVKLYVNKMKLKDQLLVPSGVKDEFGKDVMIFEPTIIIIDSITSVLSETYSPDNTKDIADMEKMRSNTEGARDAKTLKGFFKDILPLCKDANIIIYAINHINTNISMNAFIPVSKQQNFLKQDESIPGGKVMLYYPFNIVKLTAKPSDDFTEETDGFAGHIVMIEPIKCSSNQSGNNSKGISFEMVFSYKHGFDSLRTIVLYGKEKGIIEGNKTRMKFKDDDSFTFSFKSIYKEKDEKPIWENIKKYIFPVLEEHLSFVELNESKFDDRSLDY